MGVAWTAIIAAELAVGAKAGGGGSGGIGQMMFVFYAYSIELNRIVVCMIAVGLVALVLDRALRRAAAPLDAVEHGMSAARQAAPRRRRQALRRSRARATTIAVERLHARRAPGRVPGDRRAVGLRQDDRAQPARGPRARRREGTVAIDGRADHRAGPRSRRDVPGLRAVSLAHRAGQRRVRPALRPRRRRPRRRGARRSACAATIELVGLDGLGGEVSAPAFGRHAPARRARAADGQRAARCC